jgi:multidrug resistance efflux pump
MQTRRLIAVVLLSATCVTGAAWKLSRLWSTRRANTSASLQSVQEGSTLKLSGLFAAGSSVPIIAPILELDVPVNSWVKKGQVIGFSASGADPDPSLLMEARLQLAEADAAVEAAREGLNKLESEIPPVETPSVDPESRTLAVQAAAIESEHAMETRERLYREGMLSEIEHDRSVAQNRRAQQQEEGLDRPVSAQPGTAGNGPTMKPDEIRAALRSALERRRRARAEVVTLASAASPLPVVSPADGYLVQSSAYDDVFEIVPDLRRKVDASIQEKERPLLRVGQRATVAVEDQPGRVFHAVVDAIGQPQIRTAGGAIVPVTLAVTDPAGIRPESTRVSITLPISAK